MNEIVKHAADCINKLLVGNKCELPSKKVESTGETKELADSLNIRFLEASAKNAHNVEEFFQHDVKGSKQANKEAEQTAVMAPLSEEIIQVAH